MDVFGLKNSEKKAINTVFNKYIIIDKVLIYGSRAKGNFKPYSDIDLTIIAENLKLTTLQEIETELDDLLLPYKFDISIFSQISNEDLLNHIERVGQLFYEKPASK
jgi:predicted nucleotidyltransferase